MADDETGEVEELTDRYKGKAGIVDRWLTEIKLLHKSATYDAFKKIGDKLDNLYRAVGTEIDGRESTANVPMFNYFWARVQTMKPVLYSRTPKPVAERRLKKTSNAVVTMAAEIYEDVTNYSLSLEQNQFNSTIKAVVQDRLLPGLGQACVQFDGKFDKDGKVISGSERCETVYIPWRDFFWTISGTYADIRAMGHATYHSRDELKALYPGIGEKVALTYQSDEVRSHRMASEKRDMFKKAKVWHIWDKDTRQVFDICEGYKEAPLKVVKDPLRLEGFFPYPEPLLATTTTDDICPVSDYKITQGILKELNDVACQLKELRECIKYVGAHDGSMSDDIKQIRQLSNGQSWPMKRWSEFVQSSGFKGLIDWIPMEELSTVLQQLTLYFEWMLQRYWEIDGLPDIVRGNSNPNETATAQQYKGQFATLRISDKQADVQRFCRDILSKKGQVILELFNKETIAQIYGLADLPPEKQANFDAAYALLKNDTLRTFKIDIETDSTLAIDEDAYKQSVMEYLDSMSKVLSQSFQMIQIRPELTDVMLDSIMLAARSFRTGRSLEGSLEQAKEAIRANDKAAAEQGPPVDPEQIKAQADQMIQQVNEQKAQFEAAMKADFVKAERGMKDQLQLIKRDSELDLREKLLPLKEENASLKMDLQAAELKAKITDQIAKVTTAAPMEKAEKKEAQPPAQPMNVVVNLPSGSKTITMPDGRIARVDEAPPEAQ